MAASSISASAIAQFNGVTKKVIEECPSAVMTPSLRRKMGNAAVKLAKLVGYENAGTIEFLVDREKHFYFMDEHSIQVEHTVTEESRSFLHSRTD